MQTWPLPGVMGNEHGKQHASKPESMCHEPAGVDLAQAGTAQHRSALMAVAGLPSMRSIAGLPAGLLCGLWAMSAGAQTTAVSGGNPNHIDLSIPVTASVASRCGFSIGGTYSATDLNGGFTHDFTFALQCNLASRTAVVSANGGLLAPGATPPSGYTRLAPYHVALNLVGNPGVAGASADCEAAALAAAAALPCTFRGPATTSSGLKLGGASSNVAGSYLRVSAPLYAGTGKLVASSEYADVLTVTLSAAI